jgi:Ribosome biogenesis protein Nop16
MGVRNRQGKDKKRRAGRYGKIKLKNKNFKRWDPSPKVNDNQLKKLWDPSKSPAANLESLGLVAKPNDLNCDKEKHPATSIQLFDIPKSSDAPKPKRVMPLGEMEQCFLLKCLNKHGVDFKRMSMDIKVNNMQYTETQLRKLSVQFMTMDPDKLLVNVPERIMTSLKNLQESSWK